MHYLRRLQICTACGVDGLAEAMEIMRSKAVAPQQQVVLSDASARHVA
jgi:hypothetical protein